MVTVPHIDGEFDDGIGGFFVPKNYNDGNRTVTVLIHPYFAQTTFLRSRTEGMIHLINVTIQYFLLYCFYSNTLKYGNLIKILRT